MKEICLIGSYTPTKEKEDLLRNLVRQLKKNNKDILLVSHTSNTPIDIISDVKYHFYDYDNRLLTDDKYKLWYHTNIDDRVIVSRDILEFSPTIIPVSRILFFGLTISKMLGYDCAHYIEYDTIVDDISLINKNTSLIKNYDVICYSSIGEHVKFFNNHLVGAYTVFNLNSYTYNELIWDEEFILNEFIKRENHLMPENVTFNLLIKGKNYLMEDFNTISNSGIIFNLNFNDQNPKRAGKLLFDDNGVLKIYLSNTTLVNEICEVIVNNTSLITIKDIKPGWFNLRELGLTDEINNVKLYVNNNFIFEYDFTIEGSRDKFKINNFIKWE